MKKIVFWGATGQAKVLHEALQGTDFKLVALVDNQPVTSPFSGIPVLNGVEGLDAWLYGQKRGDDLYAAVAIGGGRGYDRIQFLEMFRVRGLKALTVIHPSAFVAMNAKIGEGCQILAQSAICTNVCLGNGVIVNTSASVDHDCFIGNGVHIAPGAHLAGEIVVGDRAFIGTGAIILPRILIGEDAIVGAGAVVTKNVPPKVTVVGNPSRCIKSIT